MGIEINIKSPNGCISEILWVHDGGRMQISNFANYINEEGRKGFSVKTTFIDLNEIDEDVRLKLAKEILGGGDD